MKYIFVLIFMTVAIYCGGQNDCKSFLMDYSKSIDTKIRPIYPFVETMPSIVNSEELRQLFTMYGSFVESSTCFPIYVYYGFVVEADSSISNVWICPTLMFCDVNEKIDLIKEEYIKRLTSQILKLKTSAGILNGKKVAVYTVGRVHFDPQ